MSGRKSKSESSETRKKHSGFTKGVVWVLMALLVIGLGGFGVSNFGASIRSIGAVGDEEISVNEYSLALQQELRAMSEQTGQNVSLSQANSISQALYGQSASDRVLARLYVTAALDAEADRIGLSVGDAQVRREVVQNPAFQGLDGAFDREAYRFTLNQAGLSEQEFEDGLREEIARTLLQGGLLGGLPAPETLTGTLLDHAAERRNFTWIKLDETELDAPVPTPGEEELRAYYEEHPDDFTAPEKRAITYVSLTPDMLVDTVEIDEEALRGLYDERIDEYRRPERRLVERLVFEDDAAAEAAHARLNAGEIGFDALVSERGLSLADIDLGDVAREELDGAADAVFALAEPGDYTAPQPSALGPAIFRMNGILHAQETSFEDARADLLEEFAQGRARRVIADRASTIEDMLAGGATLEEVADETEMTLGRIEWWPDLDSGIAAYDGFRAAAGRVTKDDYPEIAELEDGGIFALRLDEVIEPRLEPLDAVRESAVAGWTVQETGKRLAAMGAELADRIDAGEAVSELGHDVREERDVTRDAFIDGTPPGFIAGVFGMEPGESRVIEGPGMAAVVILEEILPPDADSPDTEELRAALDQGVAQSLGQDIFSAYAHALQAQAGISRDQAALNAVHAQFP